MILIMKVAMSCLINVLGATFLPLAQSALSGGDCCSGKYCRECVLNRHLFYLFRNVCDQWHGHKLDINPLKLKAKFFLHVSKTSRIKCEYYKIVRLRKFVRDSGGYLKENESR